LLTWVLPTPPRPDGRHRCRRERLEALPKGNTCAFISATSSDGVLVRDFTVGEVPGVLWSPASGSAVTLDAPGHGDRPRTATDEREVAALRRAMSAGEPVGPIVMRYNADIAERNLTVATGQCDVLGRTAVGAVARPARLPS
jgi:hypothetical protein